MKNMVQAGSTLLIVWAILVALSVAALGNTPISGPHDILQDLIGHDDPGHYRHRAVMSGVMAVSGLCALYGLYRPYNIGWFIPQQGVLTAAAISSLYAVAQSEYPDGVSRPWEFIGADQALMVIFTAFHLKAIARY